MTDTLPTDRHSPFHRRLHPVTTRFPRAIKRAGVCLAIGIALIGCKAEDEAAVPEPEETEQREQVASTEQGEAPDGNNAPENGRESQPLPAVAAELPEPLSSLVLGSTVLKKVDERWLQRGTDWQTLPGSTLAVDALANRHPGRESLANLVRLQLPEDFSLKKFDELWGESVAAPDNSGVVINGEPLTARYWFDDEEGVRTKLLERIRTVTWTRYTPWRTLIPVDGAPSPVLSRTVFTQRPETALQSLDAVIVPSADDASADDAAAETRKSKTRQRLALFSTEYGHLPVVIDAWVGDDGTIERVAMFVEFGNFVAGRAQMVGFLTALHENHGMPAQGTQLDINQQDADSSDSPGGKIPSDTSDAPPSDTDTTPAENDSAPGPLLRPSDKPVPTLEWEHDGVSYELQRSGSVPAAWRLRARLASTE